MFAKVWCASHQPATLCFSFCKYGRPIGLLSGHSRCGKYTPDSGICQEFLKKIVLRLHANKGVLHKGEQIVLCDVPNVEKAHKFILTLSVRFLYTENRETPVEHKKKEVRP